MIGTEWIVSPAVLDFILQRPNETKNALQLLTVLQLLDEANSPCQAVVMQMLVVR